MERTRRTILATLAVVLVSSGGLACAWLIETKPQPLRRSTFDRVLEVAVAPVTPEVAASPVVSYGTVRPKHQVRIVPQVSGELVFVNDALEAGKQIPKGELLFEIDPVVYEARVRQADAELGGLKAALERADQEQSNLTERLDNAERMLDIDESDYLSGKRLYENEQVGTQRDVDMLFQKFLRSKDSVIDLRSRLALVPHAKRETQAQLDAATARLEQAKHDLAATKITCPFDARVEVASAYQSQVVTAHFSIATLTDMSAFELVVGIDPRELRWLDRAVRPETLQAENEDPQAGPEVRVSWSMHGQDFFWRGHVSRFERVDEATRTAQLVVEIRDVDMTATVSQGNRSLRPSLSIGMHCRAELPAEALDRALLVPRHAVYDNRWVYVFEPDDGGDGRVGHLARRAVPLLRSVGDAVLVDYAGRTGTQACELQPGEQVVISPLLKPVVGMELRLRDERTADAATTEAAPAIVGARPHAAAVLASTSGAVAPSVADGGR